MELLREEIASLEAQEEIIQSKLSEELDDNRAQELMNDLNIVRNKKSEKTFELQQAQEREQQREEAIDEKVHADEIPFAIANVDLNGIPVQLIQLIEEVVKTDRKRIYNEHAIELEQLENDHEESTSKLEVEIKNLEIEWQETKLAVVDLGALYEESKSKNDRLEAANREYELLIEDANSKRDAAVREKEETFQVMDAEIHSRQAIINELRGQIAELERNAEYAERQEQPLTVSPEESTSLQEKADAVKKLFIGTDDWGSIVKVFKPDGGFELVKRADLADWEEATDVPSNEPTIEPPTQFQREDTAVQEHTMDGEVDADAITTDGGESFEQEVRRRLARLEDSLYGPNYETGGQAEAA